MNTREPGARQAHTAQRRGPSCPPVTVITGLPGTGKTRLALALAAALTDRGAPVMVVHTDILDVTGRHLDPAWPRGQERLAWTTRALDVHIAKAARDGYGLIIEGTMAAGVTTPASRLIVLEVAAAERRRRCAAKHASAAHALRAADPPGVAAAVAATAARPRLVLDAAAPIDALLSQCLDWIEPRA